ncbi:MAG TPA: type II secretion system protein [Candidatus Sulfotelmatobacter sp.]
MPRFSFPASYFAKHVHFRSGTCGGCEIQKQRGFTLIELLIVLALIVIIAAVAIPSTLEAKVNAKETSSVVSIRAINQAEMQYQVAYGGYADSLANLGRAIPARSRRRPRACSTTAWPAE